MRKIKEALVKDIGALDKEIDKADPLSCDQDAFIKRAEAIGAAVDNLALDVEDGHERLKNINTDLDNALAKLNAEKR